MQLSTEAAYQALKYWLPIATGFVMVWKGYRHAVDSFTTWVEAMLNGHLRGIQSTNEEIVVLLGTTHSCSGSSRPTKSTAARVFGADEF